MGIEDTISRACKQTAVYWNKPTNDGYGGMTFDSAYPMEIDCRWEDTTEAITMRGESRKSVEVVCKAVVYVTEDLEEEGWLFLGELTDLSSAEEDDPMSVDGAYQIKRFDKTPALGSTTVFIRKAYV